MNLNKKYIFLGAVFLSFSFSSFSFAMEEDDQPHPGGVFKKDPNSQKWAVQCQGCGTWLISTTTIYEPANKIVDITNPSLQRFHIKTCKWKPKSVVQNKKEKNK
jgi:hypothetical protein